MLVAMSAKSEASYTVHMLLGASAAYVFAFFVGPKKLNVVLRFTKNLPESSVKLLFLLVAVMGFAQWLVETEIGAQSVMTVTIVIIFLLAIASFLLAVFEHDLPKDDV